MTERLTIQMTAVMHGDTEIISESATLEAQTKEELIPGIIDWMDECTQGFREAATPVTPEALREQAFLLLTRANEIEGQADAPDVDQIKADIRARLGPGWEPVQ